MAHGRIKILHVIDSLGIGGMERVLLDAANGLDRNLFSQSICCLSARGELARFLRDGIDVIELGKGAGPDRLMPVKIARLIRRIGPDIVHSQNLAGADVAIARPAAGCFSHIHSEHGLNRAGRGPEPFRRRAGRGLLYRSCDAVFTVSDGLADYLCDQARFPRSRMRVIANGIDLKRIGQADRKGARRELGIGDDRFVIGTVSRLSPPKDPAALVESFAALCRRLPGAPLCLLVVGDGGLRQGLEKLAAGRGLSERVVFTGARADAPRLMAAMDLFALSSLSEGMPVTVLEAMAARLPVVASAVGALPEMVEDNATGFLVPAGDAGSMATALEILATDHSLAARFAAAGRSRVEIRFNSGIMVEKYTQLYLSQAQKDWGAVD